MDTQMKQALGGKTAIRDNANAFTLRAAQSSFIDGKTQPVIYEILKKIADKEGLTVEEYQQKMDKAFL